MHIWPVSSTGFCDWFNEPGLVSPPQATTMFCLPPSPPHFHHHIVITITITTVPTGHHHNTVKYSALCEADPNFRWHWPMAMIMVTIMVNYDDDDGALWWWWWWWFMMMVVMTVSSGGLIPRSQPHSPSHHQVLIKGIGHLFIFISATTHQTLFNIFHLMAQILYCWGGYTDNGPADSQDEAWKDLNWAAGLGALANQQNNAGSK